jgi:hypothetical protein
MLKGELKALGAVCCEVGCRGRGFDRVHEQSQAIVTLLVIARSMVAAQLTGRRSGLTWRMESAAAVRCPG